jgi:hypothetical protein
MLTYERSDILEIVGYTDSNFAGCLYTNRSMSDYIYSNSQVRLYRGVAPNIVLLHNL